MIWLRFLKKKLALGWKTDPIGNCMKNKPTTRSSTTTRRVETPTEEAPKNYNYKVHISTQPTMKVGENNTYVEFKAKTQIAGKEKEITCRFFGNKGKDGNILPGAAATFAKLISKKIGDTSLLYGTPTSYEKNGKRGIYFKILAVDPKRKQREVRQQPMELSR